MTLQKLFENPRFHKLTIEQRLLACVLIIYGKDGQGTADPQYLRSKPLLSDIEGIEADLEAIQEALPVKVFTREDGERFYRWLA